MTTTDPGMLLAVVPTAGELPGFGSLKDGIDPLLEWAPSPVYAAIWALIVFIVLYIVLSLLARVVLPWAGRMLPGPAGQVANVAGALLVLPEHLATTALGRLGRPVPNVVYGYDDAVQGTVSALQRAARSGGAALTRAKGTSGRWLMAIILLVFVAWNGTYCGGRGDSCEVPTTTWTKSVSTWLDEPEAPVPPR